MNQENAGLHPFVHLHVHSHYSQLDGMATISGLVDKAVNCGMKALALTDHGNMYGIKEFYDYVEKKNSKLTEDQQIKPILGVEAYCARRSHLDKITKEDRNGWHLILLAKNKKGYQNLCKLVSKAWIDGFYYKPRIDKELLTQYHEGLIVASACIGGEIPQKLLGGNAKNVDEETGRDSSTEWDSSVSISETNMQQAEEAIRWFKNLFGEDYYLELQRHKTNKSGADTKIYTYQSGVNKAILELAERTNTKCICTNDVHFVEEEHAEAHDRLICLGTGKDLDDPNRMRYSKQEWFKTTEEMNEIFSDVPQALSNTLEIAEKVENYSINSDAIMPVFPIPESFGTEESYRKRYSEEDLRSEFNIEDNSRFDKLGGYDKVLRIKLEADYLKELTMQKAVKFYGDPIPSDTLERIEFELETMKTMGFPGYFLIVQDFIQAAREMGVSVGPGRGSAAGSAVAYCLGITDIDPLKYDLLFERFLNPDRISMPDIDIDFDDDGRDEVLRWVTNKYGKEKVAHIVTYGTMATKSSIKDVARVQGVSLDESNRLVKLIPDKLPDDKKINLKNCIEAVKELREARFSEDPLLSDTLKYAEMLEGTVRQTGVHACGIIIGAEDLTNFVPLATAKDRETNEDLLVTQYEGSAIESVGLIKMDFLGLKTLSIIKETLSNIKKSKGIDINIDEISYTDKKTYELYSKGQTIGLFQFESPGMQKYLRELQPSQFEDLIAMSALYRPGPMQYIPSFINRKHGREQIQYDFPEMEKRLQDTYGITVYQEQVMLLSRDLAGFTRGQSDELRKAMGKKLVDKMHSLKEKFLKGAIEKGHNPAILEKIWSDWSEFAKYAFNKSHATCYAKVSYQTAYLKAHYPAEFMAANLTRNLNNIMEITKFMDECRAMGIKVLGPDLNESDLNFTVNKKGDIRFGLGGVKGLGGTAVEVIMKEREQNGAYKSVFDLVERVNLTTCNKKSLEALTLSGGFDNFREITREQMFAENTKGELFIETLLRYGGKCQSEKNSTMQSLFGGFESVEMSKPEIPKAEAWSAFERLNKEKELVGIYLSSHPLDDYYVALNYVCNLQMSNFEAAKTDRINQEIILGGIVTKYREGTSKNNKPYGILTIEDFSGTGEIPLFGKHLLDYGKYGRQNLILLVRGSFAPQQWAPANIAFQIRSIELLSEKNDDLVQKIAISLPLAQLDEVLLAELSEKIKPRKGATDLYLKIEDDEQQLSLMLTTNEKIKVDKEFIQYLDDKKLTFKIN